MKNSSQNTKNRQKGFTLVEVMVSVALFVTIITIGISAVLNANITHKRTEAVRQVLDNINLLAEDMARNLRTGYDYDCNYPDYATAPNPNTPTDCTDSLSIMFEGQFGDPTDSDDQIYYEIIDDINNSGFVRKGSAIDGTPQISPITLSSAVAGGLIVDIDTTQSGFTVIGSDPNDGIQPRVIIRLSGAINYKDTLVPFAVQTTVSQRKIDFPPPITPP